MWGKKSLKKHPLCKCIQANKGGIRNWECMALTNRYVWSH